MTSYGNLKKHKAENRDRTVDNLLRLRKNLKKHIPARTIRSTLLLATWNLRDFDSNKFKHGPRLSESFYYIAEIISAFDLVALQEVNENITALNRVLRILGPNWDYIATDATEGSSGNKERMTFVFDRRKVRFKRIAGEIVLSEARLIEKQRQFARTPFIVSFQSGWFKFSLCTVHLYFGAESGKKLQRRIAEIEKIGESLAKRAKKEESNIILLGDFNIVSPEHKTMQALLKSGFTVPEAMRNTTNMDRSKHYDQIAFMLRKDELQMGDSSPNSGVYDFYRILFKPSAWPEYYRAVRSKSKWKKDDKGQPMTDHGRERYFKKVWRTFQMSDHLPLWVELKIDFSEAYLEELAKQEDMADSE
jgi:endonuclease/exonuclease/phosphatase family metal-dependent hydrolase